MQVSAYQFLDIVCECLADAGTASDPPSKLRREWQPQGLALSIHPSLRLVSAKRQAVAGGARLGDGLVCGKCGSLKRSLGMVTYAVFRMAPSP